MSSDWLNRGKGAIVSGIGARRYRRSAAKYESRSWNYPAHGQAD